MLKRIKKWIQELKTEERCECGGKLKFIYIAEIGNIDEDYFADQYLCKCKKCKREMIVEYDVET